MAEFIEREALLEALENADPDVYEDYGDGTVDWGFGRKNIQDMINGIPAADVAPVVHGHRVDTGGFYARCSQCDGVLPLCVNFCPNCGAKMDGGADHE